MKNSSDEKSRIDHGMKLAAALPDIMPDQADEKIKPVYEDIQRTLRVPIVNLIFRTLANYPDYLQIVWEQLSPRLRTAAFEQAADSLRKEALLKPVPDVSEVDWEALDDLDKLRAFNDTIHYVLPKLLIITVALENATFILSKENGNSEHHASSQNIALGAAEGTTKVKMVDPDKAPAKVQRLFDLVKERHGYPLVSSYFRGLGNWPDFLEQTWDRLQPIVGSPDYEARKKELIAYSEIAARNLALPKLTQTMLNQEQSKEVQAILTAFRLKFIPEMLLDVALIKAMLDSPEEASSSRFSVAG